MSNTILIVFMAVSIGGFLVIQVLLGIALRGLFGDLKSLHKSLNDGLTFLVGTMAKIESTQERILKLLDTMIEIFHIKQASGGAYLRGDGRHQEGEAHRGEDGP